MSTVHAARRVLSTAQDTDREDNRLFEEREHAPNARRGDNWTYDSAYRLVTQERDVAATAIGNPGLTTGIEARDWTLDGVGNWSQFAVTPETGPTDTLTQSINEMNEYVGFGGVPQTHDDNGNLTDSGEFLIEYDFLNRIRKVTRKADNRLVAEYAYDGTGMAGRFGAGRRVRRTVTNSGKLNTDVTYFCDGPRVVEERSGDRETTLRQYVDGIGLDEHLTMDVFPGAQAAGAGGNGQGQGGPPPGRGRRGPPQLPPPAQAAAVRTFFFHEDGKGWVAALSDEQGNLVERVTYDAYGEPRFEDADGNAIDDQSASSVGNPYLYTGRRFDPETRFYYYRHRYYRPETGRFVSRDPLGYAGGSMGFYEYVGGNAINRWDPWGLRGWRQRLRDIDPRRRGNPYERDEGYEDVAPLTHEDERETGPDLPEECPEDIAPLEGVPDEEGELPAPLEEAEEAAANVVPGLERIRQLRDLCERYQSAEAPEDRQEIIETATKVLVALIVAEIVQYLTNPDDPAGGEGPRPPNVPSDPAQSPGEGWEWRGTGPPGSRRGTWYNPQTDESLHPDPEHPTHGPHSDYVDPSGKKWRVYPDGRMEPKE